MPTLETFLVQKFAHEILKIGFDILLLIFVLRKLCTAFLFSETSKWAYNLLCVLPYERWAGSEPYATRKYSTIVLHRTLNNGEQPIKKAKQCWLDVASITLGFDQSQSAGFFAVFRGFT